jgi:NADH:ubiquinone oxidoreductase subunit 2 (subunit N)
LWLPQSAVEANIAKKGQGRIMPLSLLTFSVGCLSLLGVPLTVAFAGRWAILSELLALGSETAVAWWLALLWLLVIGVGVLMWLRGVRFWFSATDTSQVQPDQALEPRWLQIFLGGCILVTLLISLQPQIIFNYAAQMVQAFTG